MKYQLQKDGKTLNFLAEKVGTQIWISFKGKTFTISAQPGGKSRSQKAAKGQQNGVIAPMPGKVTKIFVKPGTILRAGDVVVVMEAMKMEYTLKADRDTEVKKVGITEGSQVTLGQMLVEFEKP